MARIMAIDYGAKRVGLAVTDPMQIVASALDTVESNEIIDFLIKYVKQEEVECFVVGEPFRMDGSPSQSTEIIEKFIIKLKKEFPTIPIEREDESLTSKMAMQTMIQSGISKKKRRDKGIVDRISATIILQSYMESRGI